MYKVINTSDVIVGAMQVFTYTLHTALLSRCATMNNNDPDFHVRLIHPGLFTVRVECMMMAKR